MKRVVIRPEGSAAGPVGELAGIWMTNWRQAELQLARAHAVGDPVRVAVFRAAAAHALRRTLDGREN